MQNKQSLDFSPVDLGRNKAYFELRAAAVEATANAVVITDLNGTVVWANPSFERLTGYTEAEIVGQSTRVLKSGQNPPMLYEEMWRTLLEGSVWHGELINRRKDYSLYDEEITITPLRDRSDEVTHFVAVKQDITARKRTEERLSLLSQAMENTSEFIALGDTNSKITFANQAWLQALGYSEQELVGQSFHFILSPNNSADLLREIGAKTFEGG